MQPSAPKRLGDVLYADKSKVRVPEEDWLKLIRAIAGSDQLALHSLFEQTNRIVFNESEKTLAGIARFKEYFGHPLPKPPNLRPYDKHKRGRHPEFSVVDRNEGSLFAVVFCELRAAMLPPLWAIFAFAFCSGRLDF